MGDRSLIEWTDSTWNPVTGCSHVSAGCEHCYAEALSLRYRWSSKPWTKPNTEENVVLHPERLEQPLHWQKPRRVFVNSMSDLFHEAIPDHFIDRVFEAMYRANWHVFQVLTKRPERMERYSLDWLKRAEQASLPENIWVGVSIEQDRWCGRADVLRQVPAHVRFVSAEPLLESLPSLNLSGIQWVITGGESGVGHRPIEQEWVRDIRDYCQRTGVAFFHKQWGGRTPKAGGRLLDGLTWDEMPAPLRGFEPSVSAIDRIGRSKDIPGSGGSLP